MKFHDPLWNDNCELTTDNGNILKSMLQLSDYSYTLETRTQIW